MVNAAAPGAGGSDLSKLTDESVSGFSPTRVRERGKINTATVLQHLNIVDYAAAPTHVDYAAAPGAGVRKILILIIASIAGRRHVC